MMTAAMQELAEYGYAGMSAARIADRAGVNRTTVHRRWPNLEDLVSEALLDSASDAIAIPKSSLAGKTSGTFRADAEGRIGE